MTPGPLVPARDLIGAMLLQQGAAQDALVTLEAALKKEPNRPNVLAGVARAAELLGDDEKTRVYRARRLAPDQG